MRTTTFDEITREASRVAELCSRPVGALLALLRDVQDGGDKASREPGTRKQAGLIAHVAPDVTLSAKYEWYAVVRELHLSKRHLGHIIKRLNEPPKVSPEPSAPPPYFVTDWSEDTDTCARCGNELWDEADESTHYSYGLCSWCMHQWIKVQYE